MMTGSWKKIDGNQVWYGDIETSDVNPIRRNPLHVKTDGKWVVVHVFQLSARDITSDTFDFGSLLSYDNGWISVEGVDDEPYELSLDDFLNMEDERFILEVCAEFTRSLEAYFNKELMTTERFCKWWRVPAPV